MSKPLQIVTFGGGSGHSQVLKALKDMPEVIITGICPSTDSGGSTGVLKKEYDGSGYTGDLTKCIVALCSNTTLAKALSFRYENGPLHSHSVKNLLFHALEKVGNPEEALAAMWSVCGLGPHRVLPVTNEKTELHAELRIGNTIIGETNIDSIAKNPLWNPSVHSITDVYLRPEVKASEATLAAVDQADYIIICPGDLYSSIIPVLLPTGIQENVKNSTAKIILILNIMTKKGETDNYTAQDFIKIIESKLGRPADIILSNSAHITEEVLLKYSLEQKVEMEALTATADPRVVSQPLAIVTADDQIYSNPEVMKDFFTTLFTISLSSKKILLFDLDDTLFDSTNAPAEIEGHWPLKLIVDFKPILESGNFNKILVTRGEPELQNKKIDILNIRPYFSHIYIVPTDGDKLACFKDIVAAYPGEELVVIGNRIDCELRYGKMLGLKTILIKQGKYQDLLPQDAFEVPDITLVPANISSLINHL